MVAQRGLKMRDESRLSNRTETLANLQDCTQNPYSRAMRNVSVPGIIRFLLLFLS